MTKRKRLITTLAALLLAGCASSPGTPPATKSPTGDGPLGGQRTLFETVSAGLEVRAFCFGQARDAQGDVWAFSMSTGHEAGGLPSGFFLMANSIRNVTLFGTITGGILTHTDSGGGTAQITGLLSSGQPITLSVSDLNSAAVPDTFQFQVQNGPSFTGDYFFGGARVLRARPVVLGTEPAPGYRFDPAIGLYIVAADLDAEASPPEALPDDRAIEVVRPDPVIDFRADDQGGYVLPPGAPNNVPPASGDSSGSG
jgi:hypothetical protein